MSRLSGSDILQIGDEDGEFSRKSAASFGFDRVAVSGHGTLATVETIIPVLHRWQGNYECCPQKSSIMLHLAGMEVQDIYKDLQDPGPINAETDNAFSVCLRKLIFGPTTMSRMSAMLFVN